MNENHKLIQFIKENNYIISNEEIEEINKIINKQENEKIIQKNEKFIKSDNVSSFRVILKNWEDYEGDEYEFHSPPDCMYFEDDNIHAENIQSFGGEEFTAYKKDGTEEYFIFYPNDDEEKIIVKEWNIKKLFKIN